jgi:hypothetical protein
MGFRRPVFDIKITPQRSSPFNKVANNELAKELFGLGAFDPQKSDMALAMLDMMEFENKDIIIQKISQNGTMFQMMQQLQAQMQKMAFIIDKLGGTQMLAAMQEQMGQQPQTQQQEIPQGSSSGKVIQSNPLGKAVAVSQNNTATKAQERATSAAMPR